MAILYEVVAKNGTYQKDGQEKTKYCKMGVVMETKNGMAMKIDQVPVGWDGRCYLNEPRAKEETDPF